MGWFSDWVDRHWVWARNRVRKSFFRNLPLLQSIPGRKRRLCDEHAVCLAHSASSGLATGIASVTRARPVKANQNVCSYNTGTPFCNDVDEMSQTCSSTCTSRLAAVWRFIGVCGCKLVLCVRCYLHVRHNRYTL
jgi:hypothetical protein